MIYDFEFEELFDNKRQAVVCYLSLERRYNHLQRLIFEKKLSKSEEKSGIRSKYWNSKARRDLCMDLCYKKGVS